jgi:hypothetical protein
MRNGYILFRVSFQHYPSAINKKEIVYFGVRFTFAFHDVILDCFFLFPSIFPKNLLLQQLLYSGQICVQLIAYVVYYILVVAECDKFTRNQICLDHGRNDAVDVYVVT